MPESKNKKSISEILIEFFKKNPKREITQSEAVDHVFQFIPKARDPWRSVRKLYQDGFLIKVRKGVYMYDPNFKGKAVDEPFPPDIKEQIFKRDNYRCVVCGNGRHNGYEIHADHIIPRHLGGKSVLSNGQTLCSEHNMMKKNYGTTDFLRKYCEKMIKRAEELKDKRIVDLFKDVLKTLKKHGF